MQTVECNCGQPAKQCEVKKDGPNKGKFFWACPLPSEGGNCKFFQWVNSAPAKKPKSKYIVDSDQPPPKKIQKTEGESDNVIEDVRKISLQLLQDRITAIERHQTDLEDLFKLQQQDHHNALQEILAKIDSLSENQ